MSKFQIEASSNGWEYITTINVTCDSIKKIDDKTVLINNKIRLEFDEEISDEIIKLDK